MNKTILWVMICNALVAVAAFIKDVLLARYAGTSAEADAFTLAYFITDTVATNWLAVSLGLAGVAVYSKLAGERNFSGLNYVWKRSVAYYMVFGLIVTALLCLIVAFVFAPGLTRSLTFIMAPTIVSFSLFAVFTAYLQSVNRFVAAAASPLVMHGIFLAGTLAVSRQGLPYGEGLQRIAVCVTLGAFGTAVLTAGVLWRYLVHSRLPLAAVNCDSRGSTQWMKELWSVFGSYSMLAISGQAVLFWERGLAASVDEGVVSSLNYAYRISQVPVWIMATAIATVMLPKLSALRAANRLQESIAYTVRMLQLVVTVMLPVILMLWLLSEPVVTVLFQRGAFQWQSVALTSSLLRGYAFSLIGHSVSAIFIRYWLASGRTVQPAVFVLLSALATALLQLVLVNRFGAPGVAFGAAVGATMQALLLAFPLVKARTSIIRLKGARTILLAAAALFLVLLAARHIWQTGSFQAWEVQRIGFLFVTLSAGFAVYLLFVWNNVVQLLKEPSEQD